MTTLSFRRLSEGWLENIHVSLRDRDALLSLALLWPSAAWQPKGSFWAAGSVRNLHESLSSMGRRPVSLGPEAVRARLPLTRDSHRQSHYVSIEQNMAFKPSRWNNRHSPVVSETVSTVERLPCMRPGTGDVASKGQRPCPQGAAILVSGRQTSTQ